VDALSLRGKADFHAIEYVHDRVYAYDSTSETFMVSDNGRTWERRSQLVVLDFAVSPEDPELVVAATQDGSTATGNALRQLPGHEPQHEPELRPRAVLDVQPDLLHPALGFTKQMVSLEPQEQWLKGTLHGPDRRERAPNVVEQHQTAARFQHAGHLRRTGPVVGDAAQRQRRHDGVEGLLVEGKILRVSDAEVDVTAEIGRAPFGMREHASAQVDGSQGDALVVVRQV
jgi:hypothetical protein